VLDVTEDPVYCRVCHNGNEDHEMEERTYTAYEAAEKVGLPYRTLMRLAERGDIKLPDYKGGRGNAARWSETNVREASIWAALRRCSFSAQQLREVMDYLRNLGDNPFSSGDFLTIEGRPMRGKKQKPRDLVKIRSTGEAIELLRANRGQIMLPIWPFADEDRGRGR
jgi:hypothetical protein